MKTACLLLALAAGLYADDWRDEGVIYLAHTKEAAMEPVPVRAVTLGEGFWSERRKVNLERSIPTMLDLLEAHGILDNFRRLEGKDAPRKGPRYTDSDIYKWLEAVAFVLQSGDRPELHATADRVIDVVLKAQEPSGYLNTYYVGDKTKMRFAEMDRSHELYCLGHLLQASIAYYRATGDRKLMDGGMRYADYLIANFGPAKRPLLTGHPELEMALVELYRTTGERKYLDLAGYLLSGVETERLHLKPSDIRYMFSGVPFTSRTVFEGHAVRALYASSGATDYYSETGDPQYRKTLDTLWTDLTRHKMYITGGVGSRSEGEAFGEEYELPNEQAYGESCAAIANMMWNFRMLAVSGKAEYADVLERALYNGINSGVSLSGTLYCYRNPLASYGEKIRNEWYDTTCCPPNIQRILASLPGYFYAAAKDGFYVHLYHSSVMNWKGTRIEQKTQYPWNGDVQVTVTPSNAGEWSLYLRIPGWAQSATATVNGSEKLDAKPGSYLQIRRAWHAGDQVKLHFDTTPKLMAANPRVDEDYGKVAVQRGPLIYCLEGLDQSKPMGDLALADPQSAFSDKPTPDLLGGIVELQHAGEASATPVVDEPLYEPLNQAEAQPSAPTTLTFIPYYAWANRGQSTMEVWVPLALRTERASQSRAATFPYPARPSGDRETPPDSRSIAETSRSASEPPSAP